MTKSNFLAIYGTAHIKALTPGNIVAAFKKTGVVPFNPDVVTEQTMAPSLEMTCHGTLPLRQPSPVRLVSSLISNQME